MRKIFRFLFLLMPLCAFSQGVRAGDQSPVTQLVTSVGTQFYAVQPGATISFCNAPANGVPCTNKATTYTDSTLVTPCATSTQITLIGSTACVANPDASGRWGVWVAPGQYEYTVTTAAGSFGPYPFTAAVTTGGAADLGTLTVSKRERDCRKDGVVTGGVTDSAAAFNACISNAINLGYGKITLPCGQIRVAAPLNYTNIQGLTIEGCGPPVFGPFGELISSIGVTQVLCDTGGICNDVVGSSYIHFKDLVFRTKNAYATPSTVTFLFGRDNGGSGGGSSNPYCYGQFNVLENVGVFMDPSAAVTARGRIAVYDVGAEHFTIYGGSYRGDMPLEFAITNVLAINSPFQTLQTGCPASMTVFSQYGTTSLQAAGSNAGLEFSGAQIINGEFNNVHIINSNASATYAVNFNVSSEGAKGMRISGQFENFPSAINANGNIDSSEFKVVAVSPSSFLFGVGASVALSNSTFKIVQEGGSAQRLFSGGSSTTCKGCLIYAGATMGNSGINSSGITFTESMIFTPGTSTTPTTAAGSNYFLFNDSGIFAVGGFGVNAPLISGTAPTVSSGFGTSPTIATNNGTASFSVNVGTGGTATNGVIGLPTATNGWNCTCADLTTQSSTVFYCKQKAGSTTSATIANYNTAGAEAAWTASDIVQVSCFAR
jgi:hypothetical protein